MIGCHYFPPGPQLPSQPLRGPPPISLHGEQRHDGCEQLPKTVTRERHGYDLNPGPSASESSTLTTRLPPGHERARGALSKYRTEPTTAAPVWFLTSFGLGVGTAPDGHGERGGAGSDDGRRSATAAERNKITRTSARVHATTRDPNTTTTTTTWTLLSTDGAAVVAPAGGHVVVVV